MISYKFLKECCHICLDTRVLQVDVPSSLTARYVFATKLITHMNCKLGTQEKTECTLVWYQTH